VSYSPVETGCNPQGLPWASVGGLQLHSRVDPRREARRLAGDAELATADLVLVLGFGLGYTVEALAEAAPERPLWVIEDDAGWPATALELRAAAGCPVSLPEGLVQFLRPGHADELVGLLQDSGSRKPALVPNPAIARACPELAELARAAVRSYRDRFQVNANTLGKFGRLWVRNLARNLEAFAACPGIAGLEGSLDGVPGLLLAGGPSLDAVLPALPALRVRFALVAVDTSLRACLRAGVDPDFVVMVDPQYWNTRHLDGCAGSRAVVVSESSIFPRSLRLTAGTVLFCSSLFPLGQFFERRIGAKGPLGAGGSVATSAWDFLRYLGCRLVATAGLDLSFPGGHTHFAGSVFEEATHQGATRLRPAAMPRYDYLYNAGTYACPDDAGGMVLSDRRMDIYVQWFENQFRRHPQVSTRRLGRGSRRIEGLGSMDLDECLALPVRRPKIDAVLGAFLAAHPADTAPALDHLAAARGELVQALETLAALAGEALGEADRAAAAPDRAAPFLARLEQLDGELARAADNRIIGFLVEATIQEIATAAAPTSLAEALARSRRLYVGLMEACRFHLDLYR
jgi:hypothetical protein